MISDKELRQKDFVRTHQVECSGEYCEFKDLLNKSAIRERRLNEASCVYMWVEQKKDDHFDILYVGKAGKGVVQRLIQHRSGFKSSGTGRKNNVELQNRIHQNKEIFVYSRVASMVTFFEQKVSAYSAEEEALIAKYLPPLNRARVERRPDSGQVEVVGLEDVYHGEEIIEFIESLSEEDKILFKRLLTWALELEATAELDQKVVRGYTNQPNSLNGSPIYLFAKLGKKGNAKAHSWQVRISLSKLAVILPLKYLNPSLDKSLVDIKEQSNSFSPLDIKDFIESPSKYYSPHG
ncbi:hypothetical protein QWY20_17065 [Alkalimonas sp. MEB108]|uniref:GIY-YIG domain-containing protein n=1 Tax=Alkalimonas cellulosilytica TaxID=3058395 RepID=A0ABU7JA05_9GAMM|nr:hypothetical protein [Alkalimonas sp. MEB108]MEE2003167.1 hypothetical protein [Alkalimonas sp. MEB108]